MASSRAVLSTGRSITVVNQGSRELLQLVCRYSIGRLRCQRRIPQKSVIRSYSTPIYFSVIYSRTLQRLHLGIFWAPFRLLWAPLGLLFGLLLGSFGLLLGSFGLLWVPFGCLLGSFWAPFGRFLVAYWLPFGFLLGGFVAAFGLHLGAFWLPFGRLLGTFWELFGLNLRSFGAFLSSYWALRGPLWSSLGASLGFNSAPHGVLSTSSDSRLFLSFFWARPGFQLCLFVGPCEPFLWLLWGTSSKRWT